MDPLNLENFKAAPKAGAPAPGGLDLSKFKAGGGGSMPKIADSAVASLKAQIEPSMSGAAFKYDPKDSPIQATLKAAGNLPGSFYGFAKGAISAFNPVETVKKVGELGRSIVDSAKEAGNAPGVGALDIAKELPKAAYDTLVPDFAKHLLAGDTEKASKSLVEDPFGQVAVPVLAALGVEEANETAKAKAAPTDVPISDLKGPAKPLTAAVDALGKPISAGAKAVSDAFKAAGAATGKFTASQLSGLSPETVEQAVKGAGKVSEAMKKGMSRETVATDFNAALKSRLSDLSSTGKEYEGIRNSTDVVKVPKGTLPSTLREFGIDVTKDGKLKLSSESPPLSPADVSSIERFISQYGTEKALSGNGFLNLRRALDDMAGWEEGKTDNAERISRALRQEYDGLGKAQLKGLKELDAKYSGEIDELKGYKKEFFNKDGTLKDSAVNKIANATGAGRARLLSRLEAIKPGIADDIKTVKAIEDLQAARGQKVGTYARSVAAGGGVGAAAGAAIAGIPGAIAGSLIGLWLSEPGTVLKALETYGKASGLMESVIDRLKGKVRAGEPPTPGDERLMKKVEAASNKEKK